MTHMQNYYCKGKGLTMVEAMVVVAIIGILAAIGIPSFNNLLESRRIIGAGDNLLTNLRFAQSESLKRNASVHIVATGGQNWSYQICLSEICDPSNTLRSVAVTDYPGTNLAVTATLLTFTAKRGTLVQAPTSSATMFSFTLNGRQVGLLVNPLSQFRLCSTGGVGNYPTCPT